LIRSEKNSKFKIKVVIWIMHKKVNLKPKLLKINPRRILKRKKYLMRNLIKKSTNNIILTAKIINLLKPKNQML
jgi:hypothetical protein